MIDVLWGLIALLTAAFCWFGVIQCVHWLARVSCGPDGKRWWFWVSTTLVLLAGFALVMYYGITGLIQLAFGATTYGL